MAANLFQPPAGRLYPWALGCLLLLTAAGPATRPTTGPEPDWGPVMEGVQCAILPGPRTFAPGQRIGFTVAVRNNGVRELFVARHQATCFIELDGRWFHCFGDIEVQASPLPPGARYDDIHVWLDADWVPLDGGARLRLGAGRHELRIAVEAQNEQPFEPVARPASNRITFEVTGP
jgi:hypothetical protein